MLEGEGIRGNRRTFFMGYAQDEFKVTPQLTLNIGLRYEFYTVAHEILDRAAVVDIYGCGGFCPKGTPFYSPNPHDFGPRFGLAWAPAALGGKTTVFRTGYGIYYGGNQNDDFSDPLESAVPRYTSRQTTYRTCPTRWIRSSSRSTRCSAPRPSIAIARICPIRTGALPCSSNCPRSFTGQVAYVGSVGHHLFDRYQVNLIDPATGKRPLAQFSQFGLQGQ